MPSSVTVVVLCPTVPSIYFLSVFVSGEWPLRPHSGCATGLYPVKNAEFNCGQWL